MDQILLNEKIFDDENDNDHLEHERAMKRFEFVGRVFYQEDMDKRTSVKEEDSKDSKDSFIDNDDDFWKGLEMDNDVNNVVKEETKKKIVSKQDLNNLKTFNDHGDPFTCHVQHVVATTIFGTDIPKEPPQWGVDSPELFVDKSFYHSATYNSNIYKKQIYQPLITKVMEKLKIQFGSSPVLTNTLLPLLIGYPELLLEQNVQVDKDKEVRSIYTGTLIDKRDGYKLVFNKDGTQPQAVYMERKHALRIVSLHALFHLWRYLNASLTQYYTMDQFQDLTLVKVWTFLVSEDFDTVPIQKWAPPFFDKFSECIYNLYENVQAIREWVDDDDE